jgi:hypothetical protein
MACILDKGRTGFSCNTNAGGLKAMYVLEEFNPSLKADSTIVNGAMTSSSTSNSVFKFDLEADENTFTEENEVNRAAGTSVFTSSGTLQFAKQGSDSQSAFQKLSKMRAQIILEDHNGSFRLVGLENGVDFTVGTTSGGALGDLSGYNVTFSGKELELAPFVSPTLISASATEFSIETGGGSSVIPGSEVSDGSF